LKFFIYHNEVKGKKMPKIKKLFDQTSPHDVLIEVISSINEFPEPPEPIADPEDYNAWFLDKVQEALDSPREITYTTEEVMASVQDIIDRRQMEKTKRDQSHN
jgi:hypothetical protein